MVWGQFKAERYHTMRNQTGMLRTLLTSLALGACCLLGLSTLGCSKEEPETHMEKAGEHLKEAGEEVGEAVKETAEKAADKIEEATDGHDHSDPNHKH
jgi:hypothetical protein